jgi:hypothetical protein
MKSMYSYDKTKVLKNSTIINIGFSDVLTEFQMICINFLIQALVTIY